MGDSVFAQIISSNAYGDSISSSIGNGAFIQLVPDAPVNLENDPLTSTDVIIRFTWQDGISDGGADILSYDVYYDLGSASPFELIEAGVLT